MADQRGRIRYLSVPESLRGRIEGVAREDDPIPVFSINPDIPIPVEIPEGEEQLDLENLSWEMIVSGMLRVIAAGEAAPERLDYYRHFVLTVKPGIMAEFTEAAILKARNGGFDMALEILDILRGLFPFSPVVLLNRALVLEEQSAQIARHGRRQGRRHGRDAAYQAAEAAYGEVMALEPPFPDAFCNAGFFFMGRNDYRRAKECFSRYTEIAGDGDDEKKERAASIVREIEKNGLDDALFGEAYELARQGQEEAAMECIRDFIEDHPQVWNGWFVLGWALRRLGRWQDGAAAFSKAIELGGGNSDTRNELAICLMELGDLAAARRELEAALRGDPENVKIISNLGALAAKNGDDDEAAAFFRAALELDPDDAIAKQFLAGTAPTDA
jgi:tetratricopeptide (TPR) repeat protein